ncbi:hypothetical protein CsSME_00033854 [Camellia sinensis var. sinensis]
MTPATSPGYLCYPPPTMYLADAHSGGRSNLANELPFVSLPFFIWPSIGRDDERITLQHTNRDVDSSSAAHRVDASASVQLLTYSTLSGQYELLLSPIEPSTSPVPEEHMENAGPQPAMDSMETAEVQPEERSNQFFPFGDPRYWELPFLQGWLIGQSQAGQRTLSSLNGGAHENSSSFRETQNSAAAVPSVIPLSVGHPRVTGRSNSRHRSAHSRIMSASGSSEGAISNNITHDESDHQPFVSWIQSDLATSLAAAATAELPCTVKLRIWAHDIKDPSSPLDAGRCRLTIPHAVLCSEMGAHFSPCGRFLAAWVACVLPHLESDPGLHSQVHHDVTGVSTSPTRHPISAHQVIFELRIYSLKEATFGLVLAS